MRGFMTFTGLVITGAIFIPVFIGCCIGLAYTRESPPRADYLETKGSGHRIDTYANDNWMHGD